MKLKSFIIVLILLLACNASAATYYVKTGGNDSAAGTSDATAWAHCPGMAGWTGSATLTSGDKVYFHEGDTWASDGEPILTATAGVSYYGLGYGVAGTRAVLRSTSTKEYTSPSPTHGMVDIDVSNVTFYGFDVDADEKQIGGIYVTMYRNTGNVSNITIDNCLVHDTGGATYTNDKNTYVYTIIIGQNQKYTTSYVTVQNSQIYNTAHEGITIYPSSNITDGVNPNRIEYVTIRNNIVHDVSYWGATNWGHGIDCGNWSTNITIEYNTLYNIGNGAIAAVTFYHDPTYGYPDEVTIRYNNIYKGTGTYTTTKGIVLAPHNDAYTGWGNMYVYGNLLYDSMIYLAGGNYWSKSNLIYNNTIYNPTASIRGVWFYETTPSNTGGVELKNNIIYANYYCLDDVGANLSVHSNNLYYRASGNLVRRGASTYYDASTIHDFEAVCQHTDPTFTGGDLPTCFSDATGVCGTGTYGVDLRPNTTYFAITSGDALGNGAVLASDYNKAINNAGTDSTYTRGTAWDIGAYEYTLDGGATIVNTGAVFSGCTF